MKPNPNRIFLILPFMAFAVLGIWLFLPQAAASAHPVDMYAQNQSIQLTPDGILINWKITPGPMLADAIWNAADQNGDGAISQDEAQVWIQPYLSQWSFKIDDQAFDSLRFQAIQWPDNFDALQTGDQSIIVQSFIPWPGKLAGRHLIEFHNSYQEAISLDWYSIESDPRFTFEEPEQSKGQLRVYVSFSDSNKKSAPEPASALTSWESGKPNLPGLTGSITNLALNLANSGRAGGPPSSLSGPTSALVGLVRTEHFSAWFLAGAFVLSLALGSLHALTPGHGKALVAAYLVGSHGRTRDAIFLGSIVTVTHTGSVLLLGLVTLVASRYILPTVILPWLEIISGILVVGFGINLFIRRGRALYTRFKTERINKYARHGYHAHQTITVIDQTVGIARPHVHSDETVHPAHEHDHEHPTIQTARHEHTHSLPADQVTWRSLLSLGISGGLVPCPDAIAILLVAVTLNRIPLGMLLIVAFSLGLAIILIGIGIAMVQGFRFLSRSERINRFSIYSPLVSAVVVSGLGFGLTLSALHTLRPSPSAPATARPNAGAASSTAANSDKNIGSQGARIVYLSQDSQFRDQLSVASISGGRPITLTQEQYGIQEYSLAPDNRTILYSILDIDGTSIWTIRTDGSEKHLVVDCPQLQCGGAVWSPDGQKVFYERGVVDQTSMISLYSMWSLDLQSGETKSVFQDQSFPSLAPRFSPDGRWLSYISPSTNTIQIYNLQGDRSLSVSSRYAMPEIWSPAGDSLLFWDTKSQDTTAIPHLEKYDLASEQITDLSASDHQDNYEAAWSPDGKWIAIAREITDSDSSNSKEQIILAKPDGSPDRILLSQTDYTYGDLSWSPESRFLLYTQYSRRNAGGPEIWMVDIQSGQQTQIVSEGKQAVWLP